jgi:hypothetical protein
MTKKKEKRKSSNKGHTPLSGHFRDGSMLKPPFAKLTKMSPCSWMNDRLPEMVWAALIIAHHGRDNAIIIFRKFLSFIGNHNCHKQLSDVTLTGISNLPSHLKEEVIAHICSIDSVSYCLSPLLLFDSLPSRDMWAKYLPTLDKPPVNLLMEAVGTTLFHQSQEATDCRWVKVTAQIVAGMFHVPPDIAEQYLGYPEVGDQRSVRPSIRASEMSENPLNPPDRTWPKNFWAECWDHTECFELDDVDTPERQDVITVEHLQKIGSELWNHWELTHTTTAIDAKHDAVFGAAFYGLQLLVELVVMNSVTIAGRLILRTLLETNITLSYLCQKDNPKLWEQWRQYGAGQVKLTWLKLDEMEKKPSYISFEHLENISNEDIWQEMLNIEIGHWNKTDLRKLSIEANKKDLYDKFYPWTSGYVHGNWGAIRATVFETCGNPLHRLHRHPCSPKMHDDVIPDACVLVEDLLLLVDKVYPSFPYRILYEIEDSTIE